MTRDVTLRGLNREYARALFSSNDFWTGVTLYILGAFCLTFSLTIAGVIMLIAGLIMINSDWKGRNKVVKNLRWKK